MNIFVTDPSAVKSAQVLPDKHIVKMPLETCQMLSIVASDKWGYGFGTLPKLDGTPYKTEHGAFRNHPCTIWAQTNFTWLIVHGLALCNEYTHRYGKKHSCQSTIEHAVKIFPPQDSDPQSLCLQDLMSSSMMIVRISLQSTKTIFFQNHGQEITIYVTHQEDQNGCGKS